MLPAWTRSRKRKAIGTAKQYFFDVGVARHLQRRSGLARRSPEFGEAFESYLLHEIATYIDYTDPAVPLAYRTAKAGFVARASPGAVRKRNETVTSGGGIHRAAPVHDFLRISTKGAIAGFGRDGEPRSCTVV
jgi:hypothetical protein